MLVDANLLIYAVDRASPWHDGARRWWEGALNGSRRVGLPWASLTAFLRIVTHPRASSRPLSSGDAWEVVDAWLRCDVVWTPNPTARHGDVLGGLVQRYDLRGNLIPDAYLAALAVEHGLVVVSADTDFARFSEIEWRNPLA